MTAPHISLCSFSGELKTVANFIHHAVIYYLSPIPDILGQVTNDL